MIYPPAAMKKAILQASQWKCFYCGDAATDVEHVVPISKKGTGALGNLVASCNPCNLTKGRHRLPCAEEQAALIEAKRIEPIVTDLLSKRRVNKGGRPPVSAGFKNKSVSLPDDMWVDLDRVRRTFSRIPSEAEAIRLLLREAMDARLKGGRRNER